MANVSVGKLDGMTVNLPEGLMLEGTSGKVERIKKRSSKGQVQLVFAEGLSRWFDMTETIEVDDKVEKAVQKKAVTEAKETVS